VCGAGLERVREVDVTFDLAAASDHPSAGPALLARTIGIETLGGVLTPLVIRCSRLPAEHVEIFSTASDNQSSIEVHLLTGELPRAAENKTLAKLHLAGLRRAPRGILRIEVKLGVDRRGHVAVSARDLETGRGQDIVVDIGQHSPTEARQ